MAKLSNALLAIIMLVGSSVSLYGNNVFYKADSSHLALKSAKSKGKLLLTYAARTRAPSCIAMEKASFQSSSVQNLLKSNFYSIKINLANNIGKTWIEEFQIVSAPTLLFFDSDGTLIKQVENGLSSHELQSVLEEVLFYHKNGYWPMEIQQPVVLTAYAPSMSTSSNSSDKIATATPTDHLPTFKILLDQVSTDDPSIEEIVKRAKLNFPEYSIKAKLYKENEKPYYQLWFGEFSTYSNAQLLLDLLLGHGFDNAQLISISRNQ